MAKHAQRIIQDSLEQTIELEEVDARWVTLLLLLLLPSSCGPWGPDASWQCLQALYPFHWCLHNVNRGGVGAGGECGEGGQVL